MAFQYASYSVPQAPPSSLASFMPAFEAGQQKRLDLEGAKAAAGLYSNSGPYQQQPPQPLAALDPNAVPASNPQNPPTVGDRASQLSAYTGSVAARESSGNPNAVNPTSGATGLYQFLPSTWQDLMQRHPELGLTPEGIKDPAQQQKAFPVFTAENAKTLAASGVQPNPTSLYAAHLLGGGGASKVLSQPDATPLSAVVDPAALQANPNIAGMNVGQFKQWVAQQGPQGQGGGYSPPMAQSGPMPSGSMALPSRDTMLALFRSPDTRPLAMAMVQAVQAGQSPAGILDMALKRAQIAETQRSANLPMTVGANETVLDPNSHQTILTTPPAPESGFRNVQGGGQTFIPGGPQDPAVKANQTRQTQLADAQGKAQVNLPSVVDNASQMLTTLDKLLPPVDAQGNPLLDAQGNPVPNKGLDEQFMSFLGIPVGQRTGAIPGTEKANFQAVIDQVKGGAFLQSFNQLRGGGQISNVEGDKATAALAQLSTDQSKEAFMASIKTFMGVVRDGLNRAKAQAAGQFDQGATAPQPQNGPPAITSDADYAALPSGAQFKAPDGTIRQKP